MLRGSGGDVWPCSSRCAALGACGGSDHFSLAGSGGTAGSDGGSTAGSGGSGGATGGTGAVADAGQDAPCTSTDADGDGVTTCQGDCDDNDRNTYPGAPEICGDGRSNGCTGAPADQGCGGLGTFVSTKVGNQNDTGKGTMTDPVLTIAHGIKNATTILQNNPSMKSITVYVADGHYPEKVTLVEGINLLGGFSCETAPNCTWKRDPAAFDTAILDQDDEGLLVPHTITRNTLLDGFRVQGHDTATPTSQPGAAAISIAGGSPHISNNTINGPNISGSGNTARAVGIALAGSGSNSIQKPGPLIEKNAIDGGQAAESSTGILFGAPRNYGGSQPPGTVAELVSNIISGGTAKSSYGISAFTSTDGTLVFSNIIDGGQGLDDSWGIGFSSVLEIDANTINTTQTPSCTNSNRWCGGILSWSGDGVITNNIVYGAGAPQSAALRLTRSEQQVQEVVVSSNFLVGAPPAAAGKLPSRDAVVVLQNPGCSGCSTAIVGRIRNNFMMPGRAAARFGILEEAGAQDIHPEKIENNDFWFIPYSTSASGNVVYRQHNVGSDLDLGLPATNALSFAANNFSADCYDTTFHLTSGAKCINAGVSSDAPDHDFEGDARPNKGGKFDVGPDEAP